MGRFEWDDYGDPVEYRNGDALFAARARQAIYSKRGRAALAELREALMHLPKHELIEGAVCRRRDLEDEELPAEVVPVAPGQLTIDGGEPSAFVSVGGIMVAPTQAIKIEGVCAVGAYVWWQKVKAGKDPVAAFTELPELDTGEDGEDAEGGEMFETAWLGEKAGLTYTLAWELASGNDETFAGLDPATRWQRFVDWIDGVLAAPPLKRGQKAPGERLGHSWSA